MKETQSLNLSNPSFGVFNMPNSTTSRQLARIRAQYDAQQAALNARRYEQLKRFIESPQAHWCGVSERTLAILRSNRDMLTSSEYGVNEAPIAYVPQSSYYFPRLAPQVGSLVEHDLFGLGIRRLLIGEGHIGDVNRLLLLKQAARLPFLHWLHVLCAHIHALHDHRVRRIGLGVARSLLSVHRDGAVFGLILSSFVLEGT